MTGFLTFVGAWALLMLAVLFLVWAAGFVGMSYTTKEKLIAFKKFQDSRWHLLLNEIEDHGTIIRELEDSVNASKTKGLRKQR